MTVTTKRSTIYFDEGLYEALRQKAAHTSCSISCIVNDAVRGMLAEDQEDLSAFEVRGGEPLLSYEELLNSPRVRSPSGREQ